MQKLLFFFSKFHSFISLTIFNGNDDDIKKKIMKYVELQISSDFFRQITGYFVFHPLTSFNKTCKTTPTYIIELKKKREKKNNYKQKKANLNQREEKKNIYYTEHE